MTYETRPLTKEEIMNFPGPGENCPDVAMLSSNGQWYYAESGQQEGPDHSVMDATEFVTDEDGDYIPVQPQRNK